MGRENMDRKIDQEMGVIRQFLEACPTLASTVDLSAIKHGGYEFPDVTMTQLEGTEKGTQIGFELVELVVQMEIEDAKKQNYLERDLEEILQQQGQNSSANIDEVRICPARGCPRISKADREEVWNELLALIGIADKDSFPLPNNTRCVPVDKSYPTLKKYVTRVVFSGRAGHAPSKSQRPWMQVLSRGNSYSSESTEGALRRIIKQKLDRYRGPLGYPVDLLIHYGATAFCCNAPFMDTEIPHFEALGRIAHNILAGAEKCLFRNVYLCNMIPCEREAYLVHPTFSICH